MNLREVIGGRCSVISKSGIRYVGTLISIESEQKTLSFEKVVSFGTEGRLGTGRDVPPSSNVFEHIVFKAAEITALKLVEPAAPDYQQSPAFYDPAIVESAKGPAPQSHATPTMAPSPFQDGYNQTVNAPQPYIPQPSSVPAYPPQNASYSSPRPHNDSVPSYAQSAAAPVNQQPRNAPRSNNRQDHHQSRPRNTPTLPKQDFDFESFNAQFNKEEVLKEIAGDGFEHSSEAAPFTDPKNFYDKKSSFFDNISCDSKNKAEGVTRDRLTSGQGRKTNQETFGENYSSNNYNRYHVNHRNGQRGGPRPRGNRNGNPPGPGNQGYAGQVNGRAPGNPRPQ
ncbi:hypothetical protein DSO57_1000323 [Entomophthora muscae]|uniref:Uncharacterized protein n=1 Tax=Entomophthora muscae TaxID=34485 RepID=A0ACC2TJY8_9FUNG|nr:hypothetical protein DSO57_1000323 [Entomophthora muscae]